MRLRMVPGPRGGAQAGVGRAPPQYRTFGVLLWVHQVSAARVVHMCVSQPCGEVVGCPEGVCRTSVWMLFTEKEKRYRCDGFHVMIDAPSTAPRETFCS